MNLKVDKIIFFLLIFAIVAQIVVSKLDLFTEFPLVKYFDEIIAIISLCYIFSVNDFIWKYDHFKKILLFVILFLIVGFIPLGILENITNKLSQLFLNIKVVLISIAGSIYLSRIATSNLHVKIESLLKFIVVINIPFIVFQFLAPEIYDSLFNEKGTAGRISIQGLSLSRAVGVFYHPSQLAIFCCFTFLIFTLKRIKFKKFWLIATMSELILTMQRQEIIALVLVVYFVNVILKVKSRPNRLLIILKYTTLLAIITIFFVDFFSESFSVYSNRMGFDDPRLIFFRDSLKLASRYFPFGSGLGTFGGQIAFATDSRLYTEFDYYQYEFYRNSMYMTDTYYPQLIGETGILGTALFFAIIWHLVKLLTKRGNSIERFIVKSQFAFCLIVSLTSPILNDMLCITLLTISPFALSRMELKNRNLVYGKSIGSFSRTKLY
jgi:hypothetical protein